MAIIFFRIFTENNPARGTGKNIIMPDVNRVSNLTDEEFYSTVKNFETMKNTGTVSLELLDYPATEIEVKKLLKVWN